MNKARVLPRVAFWSVAALTLAAVCLRTAAFLTGYDGDIGYFRSAAVTVVYRVLCLFVVLIPAVCGMLIPEGGLSAVRLEGQARPLTDEEIQAAYFRAEEAYGWFSLETLPCGEKTQTIDGWLYYPVEYPGMENLADLRAYLRGLFSEELVDALLASGGAHPLYQDVDGALYVLPTSRERDESKGQADIQIKPYGQAGYSVIVEVDLLADGGSTVTGVESYAFPYEFQEDRWVFTDFHLIY